jgi:hypothetical protein
MGHVGKVENEASRITETQVRFKARFSLIFFWFPNNLHFIHVLLQKQDQTHEINARCLQISNEIFPVVQNGIYFAQKVPNFAYFVKKNISWNNPQILRNTGQGQLLCHLGLY